MSKTRVVRAMGRLSWLVMFAASVAAAQAVAPKPQDTEFYTPVPPKVTPPPLAPAPPPAGAIVLFDGKNLDEWINVKDGAPAGWTLTGGVVTVNKRVGDIRTRRTFKNYQLHVEWRIPADITGRGQLRGNSGVHLAAPGKADSGYELQVLDSWDNPTYTNGQAGSIYKQYPPLVNVSRPPGEWQAYDVLWTAPTFDAEGKVKTPARATVRQNGVLIQDDVTLRGETRYIGPPVYIAYDTAPMKLQAHADPSEPVSFRNIWIKPLP